jgi:hypothetical protein
MQKEPYILTLGLDASSQDFFDKQRESYFPRERNYLKAHLTLFHQLPPLPQTFAFLQQLDVQPFDMQVVSLMKLGAGVAYRIESDGLMRVYQNIKQHFSPYLIPQDKQPFRPHITIQNKVAIPQAEALFNRLNEDFKPFIINGNALQLWTYLGGPWRYEHTFSFR